MFVGPRAVNKKKKKKDLPLYVIISLCICWREKCEVPLNAQEPRGCFGSALIFVVVSGTG